MKRPLVAVALCYLGGIPLALLPAPLWLLFVAALGLIAIFIVWPSARAVTLGALIMLTGWVNMARLTATLSPFDLRSVQGSQTELVILRGVLCETPIRRVHRERGRDVWSFSAQMEASAMRGDKGDWQPVYGRIIASTKGDLPDTLYAGETVEIPGTLEPAPEAIAEGLFDYRNFLANQGIYYELHVEDPSKWRVVSPPTARPLADRFCAWARRTLALGMPVEDESLRLEWALTLGWKAALTDEVSEPFIRASTYHIFAVDGLRITIVSGIFLIILKVLGVPRAACGLVIVPVIWFYAAMTGWPASAIRAIVMFMVVIGGWVLNRPGDLINSLFAAALVILVWEPRQLFQAGFQLSFFVVLCIILILPFFENLGHRLFRGDPMLPESLRPRWRKYFDPPARVVVELLLTSTAAWLGSIPLVAWYFHLVTPLSGPANVPAVPLCAGVLICNLSSLLLGAWLPAGSVLFNHAAWFLMKGIITTSEWSANWRGAYFYLPMPGWFTIALYYAILLAVLTGWIFRDKWRIWKISGLTLLAAVWCGLWIWERPVTRITILPLQRALAVYARAPGAGPDWLINCGNEVQTERIVKPFLQAQGVNRLDNFILTHGAVDYTGGAKIITALFNPRNIHASSVPFRSLRYRDFVDQQNGKPGFRRTPQPGDQLGPWTMLYPGRDAMLSKAEDKVLVLRGEFNGIRILLLSDLSHAGQRALLSQATDLRADVVAAAVPEKGEPLMDPLLDAIQPRVIVVADDTSTRKAGEELRTRLGRRKVPVLYTHEVEAITLTTRPGQWRLIARDGTMISSVNPNP